MTPTLSASAATTAVLSPADAVSHLIDDGRRLHFIPEALGRTWFTPTEDEQLKLWFARFLSLRAALWDTVEETRAYLADPRETMDLETRRRFIPAYAAGCLIAALDRFLVEDLGDADLLVRKFNEPDPHHRIPRKQWTASYKSLTHPLNAWRMYEAKRHFRKNPALLTDLGTDPVVGPLTRRLPALERALQSGFRRYLRTWIRNRDHSFRRRGASAGEKTQFRFLELSGRTASEFRDPFAPKRVTPAVQARMAQLLQIGDVLITRHDHALTNLFLPGYWPHAALYVGTAAQRAQLPAPSPLLEPRLADPICVLEALKDGVHFRALNTTLAVDAVAIIRPHLSTQDLARALERAMQHEGKPYNFDFSFFSADRLVCTEVVYRAMDGLGGLNIALTKRTGRLTLSAEDLLDAALAGNGFKPVALFGAHNCPDQLVTGPELSEMLAQTYRRPTA